MSSNPEKKTVTQEELRKMMKEKTGANKQQINSPYAKYNSRGQLFCTLCSTIIKNEKLWNAHVLSRTHKENLSRPTETRTLAMQRKRPPEEDACVPEAKRAKSVTINPVAKIYGSDDENEEDDGHNKGSDADQSNKGNDADQSNDKKDTSDVASYLPEGFFDDPKLDAKARNIPFKDKMEAEMELFQKAIKEEDIISEAIMEVDDDEREGQKELHEVDEQMNLWGKVLSLARTKKPVTRTQVKEESDEDDDIDLDGVLDWKSKRGLKLNL